MAVFGTATAAVALLFTIDTLVQFLSIGTLLAYTFVSACVIILRYRPTIEADDISQVPGISSLLVLNFITQPNVSKCTTLILTSVRWLYKIVGTWRKMVTFG